MEKIDRIYKVYDGELKSVEVKKTTKKLVYIDRVLEFNCVKTLDKMHVCVTPQEAIQEYKNRALTQIGMFEDRLGLARLMLRQAEELESKHTKEK